MENIDDIFKHKPGSYIEHRLYLWELFCHHKPFVTHASDNTLTNEKRNQFCIKYTRINVGRLYPKSSSNR